MSLGPVELNKVGRTSEAIWDTGAAEALSELTGGSSENRRSSPPSWKTGPAGDKERVGAGRALERTRWSLIQRDKACRVPMKLGPTSVRLTRFEPSTNVRRTFEKE